MHERLTPGQLETAEKLSRRYENAWRIITYPGRYSQIEAEKSMDFFEREGKKLAQSLHEDMDPKIIELLNSLFLGIFHRNITLPLELKWKPLSLN